ncbi:transglycosylase domain-containing protein [Pseudonocardia saturnea]
MVVAGGALLGGLLAAPVAGLARVTPAALPGTAVITLPDPDAVPLVTVVTDAGGAPIVRLYEQYRLPTGPDGVAPVLEDAVIAIEDRRFHQHGGLDLRSLGRALATNLRADGNPLSGQGASTITMQYVKNHRLLTAATPAGREAADAPTLVRKLLDVQVALALEERLGKDEILARYLDTVYFGNGAYGVTAAARTYFDTVPAELDLARAALLAALVRAPAAYDPVRHPEAALARRDLVLDAMVEVGSVTAEEAGAAGKQGLGLVDPLRRADDGCVAARPGTGFFCRYLLRHLADLGLEAAELRSGGYTIRSTLDLRVTDAARSAAAGQVPVAGTEGIANAVAVVRPGRERHRVLALTANRDLGPDASAGQSAYPLPSAPVPYGAGSTYKIFTAAAALERGLGVGTQLPAPETYTSRVYRDRGEPYEVSGAGGATDEVDLQDALTLSPNTTFLALLDRLGSVDPVVDVARRLGLRDSLREPTGGGRSVGEAVRAEEQASFTFGPVPTSPLELANVAATIVSGGVWCPPSPVDEVLDSTGAPVPLPERPCERAVEEDVATTLAFALSEDHTRGTAAAAARAAGWDRPMIGKTGTTQQHLSAAFVGATPQLAGSVLTWADRSPPRPVCDGAPPRLCDEGTLFGGTVPARTWFATMSPLHDGLPIAALPAAPADGYRTGELGPPDG